MFPVINEVSVVVVAVLSVAIANIWYSPLLFGGAWSRALGNSEFENGLSKKELYATATKAFVVSCAFFGVLAWGLSVLTKVLPLSAVSLFLFMLLVTHGALSAVWEKRPVTYILANAGYSALIFFGGVGVIAYWPW